MTTRKIAGVTGRGGTSGIGVAAFEKGGFIVDGGHSIKEKKGFLPSSASKATPPPIISRQNFPDWKIVVVIPELMGFSGTREINLFERCCPIAIEDVRRITHLILMKLLPSIVEWDLDEFGEAIWSIQHLGFKRAEIDQYGGLIWRALELARGLAPAVGMSSTGPAIYAITDANPKSVVKTCVRYFEENGLKCRGVITKARNRGADIEVIE
jgi:beta-ribofuranosylaminobenzene 5'-phosphate synthase